MILPNSTIISTISAILAVASSTPALIPSSTVVATATSRASAASPSATSAREISVQRCGQRMNGQLPSFVPNGFEYSGTSRSYFIQAETHIWDYVPSKWDNMRGIPIEDTPQAIGNDYAKNENSLGSKYIKSLFKGYTDSTFTTLTPQPDWVGFQGPIVRAEVGDMIEVMIFNNISHVMNVHSMGLQYTPESEGSNYYRGSYANGTAMNFDGANIHPGDCFVYKWLVTSHSAPDPGQYSPNSKLWSYHGDENLQNDVFSGLLGPVLIYNRGQMETIMNSHKEYILFIATTNEAESYYVNDNVAMDDPTATFIATPSAPTPTIESKANATIWENIFDDLPASGSNTSLAQQWMVMNGYGFNSMPPLQMCQDDNVIWHFWSMGGFNDGFHSIHLHGHNVRLNTGAYVAQVSLSPASMSSVSMQAQNPGVWQLLCHVGDHWQGGMEINYNVTRTGVAQC